MAANLDDMDELVLRFNRDVNLMIDDKRPIAITAIKNLTQMIQSSQVSLHD